MPAQYQPDGAGSSERPGVISVLGILSFINTGAFLLVYGIGWLAMSAVGRMPYDEFAAKAEEALGPMRSGMPEEDLAQMDIMLPLLHASGALLLGLLFMRTLVRLVGTIGIWRAKRSGFYTYAAAQIIGIFLPMVVLPWSQLGVIGPLMAVGMTAAFGSQLKRLN
ncbi:MAG: hypothetical protein IPJ76_01845 [Flavobacteriales bacterium]|nr:MAG: hypothetical protein IPJ76_01845 [Flavobacteriales bacterium]